MGKIDEKAGKFTEQRILAKSFCFYFFVIETVIIEEVIPNIYMSNC